MKKKNINGFTLVELLVVMTIFAVVSVLTIQAVSISLKTSKKSDSLVRVRENVNYSLAILERQLRNSLNITSACTGTPNTSISYTSMEGIATSFSCDPIESGYIIASGSARLTSDDITITACSFTCTQTTNNPARIEVSVTERDTTTTTTEIGSITTEMEIVTRNY